MEKLKDINCLNGHKSWVHETKDWKQIFELYLELGGKRKGSSIPRPKRPGLGLLFADGRVGYRTDARYFEDHLDYHSLRGDVLLDLLQELKKDRDKNPQASDSVRKAFHVLQQAKQELEKQRDLDRKRIQVVSADLKEINASLKALKKINKSLS